MQQYPSRNMSAKWDAYYALSGGPPWESGGPVSQVVAALASGALPVGGSVLEVGCGSGATTRFLSRHYHRTVGLDISPEALRLARLREEAPGAGGRAIDWVLADILDASTLRDLRAAFDVVVDVQTYHALAGTIAPRDTVAAAFGDCLRPGGRLLVIAGNATEPPRLVPGPSLLKRDELVCPFETAGLVLESVEASRFDATPAYGDTPPLAWVAIFSKPSTPTATTGR
jgi:SAM-dependent methyltransferase